MKSLLLVAIFAAAASAWEAPPHCTFNVSAATPFNASLLSGIWYEDSTTLPRPTIPIVCQKFSFANRKPKIFVNTTTVISRCQQCVGNSIFYDNGLVWPANGTDEEEKNSTYYKYYGYLQDVRDGHPVGQKYYRTLYFITSDAEYKNYVMLYRCVKSGFYRGEDVIVLSRNRAGLKFKERLKLQHLLQRRFGWNAYLTQQLNTGCP